MKRVMISTPEYEWKKHPQRIFCRNDQVKGAGHCSIICGEQGHDIFFHAWDADENLEDEHIAAWQRVSAWHGKLLDRNKILIVE